MLERGKTTPLIIFALAIIIRSVYFTNFYIAGLQSEHIERFTDFFIPLFTLLIHLLLLRFLPTVLYRMIAVVDFLLEVGFATYEQYFGENIDIHAIFSSTSEGMQVVDYIFDLVPKPFFIAGVILLIIQFALAGRAKSSLRNAILAALAIIVVPMFAFACYKIPISNAKNVVGYTMAIKVQGFYTAMLSDLIFTGRTPSDEELIQDVTRENTKHPIQKIDVAFSSQERYDDLLVIQIETLDFHLLGFRYKGKEVTPFLNRLRDHSLLLKLDAFHYGPSGSSGADFQFLTGLLPPENYPAFKIQSMQYETALPRLFLERGVRSFAFHGNTASMFGRGRAYEKMRFERFYDPAFFPRKDARWGISDRLFFQQSNNIISKPTGKPDFYFLITLSSHGPFNFVEHHVFEGSDMMSRYFNSLNYVDSAVFDFLRSLRGDYLVLIYGDHTAGLRTQEYESRENGFEYVPGYICFVRNGRISKPLIKSVPSNLMEGTLDIRSLHFFALDHFPQSAAE
jgi:phosphoglycerol transferase MdoB-like AlkP superfamily enzyme